jgi:hypothetical protein
MFHAYRSGKYPISEKAWKKLEHAEQAAGRCEKKPGDVVRESEVKELSEESEKISGAQHALDGLRNMQLPAMGWMTKQEAADLAAEVPVSMEQRMAALEAQVRLQGAALDALLRERR